MDIYRKILDQLKKEYDNGATYQEMAGKYGISYQYLRELMQGIKPTERMSLEFLFKLFPNATLNLNGDTVNAKNSGVNNGVMGINHGSVNTETTASTEAFRNGAIQAVIGMDIPPEISIEVLKILKALKT